MSDNNLYDFNSLSESGDDSSKNDTAAAGAGSSNNGAAAMDAESLSNFGGLAESCDNKVGPWQLVIWADIAGDKEVYWLDAIYEIFVRKYPKDNKDIFTKLKLFILEPWQPLFKRKERYSELKKEIRDAEFIESIFISKSERTTYNIQNLFDSIKSQHTILYLYGHGDEDKERKNRAVFGTGLGTPNTVISGDNLIDLVKTTDKYLIVLSVMCYGKCFLPLEYDIPRLIYVAFDQDRKGRTDDYKCDTCVKPSNDKEEEFLSLFLHNLPRDILTISDAKYYILWRFKNDIIKKGYYIQTSTPEPDFCIDYVGNDDPSESTRAAAGAGGPSGPAAGGRRASRRKSRRRQRNLRRRRTLNRKHK